MPFTIKKSFPENATGWKIDDRNLKIKPGYQRFTKNIPPKKLSRFKFFTDLFKFISFGAYALYLKFSEKGKLESQNLKD